MLFAKSLLAHSSEKCFFASVIFIVFSIITIRPNYKGFGFILIAAAPLEKQRDASRSRSHRYKKRCCVCRLCLAKLKPNVILTGVFPYFAYGPGSGLHRFSRGPSLFDFCSRQFSTFKAFILEKWRVLAVTIVNWFVSAEAAINTSSMPID